MSSLDQLRATFFDECSDALQQMEAGLMEMQGDQVSEDTVNSVFRSVHSVKGGAGIFGFESLVNFAHVLETVLDLVRGKKIEATEEVVDVLLAAADILSDLITMTRAGEAIPDGFGGEVRQQLEQIIPASDDATGAQDRDIAMDFAGIDFVPVRSDEFEEAGAQNGPHVYEIAFRPTANMLAAGVEPSVVFAELQRLGRLELTANVDELPELDQLDPGKVYIDWSGILETEASVAEIEAVFAAIAGDCERQIREIRQEKSNEVAFGEALPSNTLPVDFVPPPELASTPKPSASAKPSGEASSPAKPAATTTRVELEKIDRVVNMVGELVIAQAMLGQIVQTLPEEISGRLAQVMDEVTHHTRELKDSVMSMRAQSVSAVFQRMPRLVRELAHKTSKKVRIEMAGENTEIDRSIIERLSDPLTHIIRNSIDHGIELPGARVEAGKDEEGTIRLAAEHRGGRIVIQISDDGAGVNSERVLKKAQEKGLVPHDAALSDDEINNLIFMPGFSTAEAVSDISGRGVGMDVVRRNIQDVGGRITLRSEAGRGMTIQLALPLTLAVMDGMVIKVGRETYVVPMSAIIECLRPRAADIHASMTTRGMLQLRGSLVPIIDLKELLDIEALPSDSEERVIIITDAGEGARVGVIVDELCGHQQVVIKSIEASYGPVPGIAGATILGNGRVAFILDVEKLSDLATNQFSPGSTSRPLNADAA